MGYYLEQVLPRIQNKVMDNKRMRQARERVCHGLHGEIVEIGFGTGLNATHYPDAVTKILSTWTLCTIPDLDVALGEIRRVLKPGGALHFIEHGHAPDEKIARWQRRIEPLNKRLLGGCHLTRRISESIEQAGFEVDHLDTYYAKGDPKPFGFTYEGHALKK